MLVRNSERTREADRVAPGVRRREIDEGTVCVQPSLAANGVGFRCEVCISATSLSHCRDRRCRTRTGALARCRHTVQPEGAGASSLGIAALLCADAASADRARDRNACSHLTLERQRSPKLTGERPDELEPE